MFHFGVERLLRLLQAKNERCAEYSLIRRLPGPHPDPYAPWVITDSSLLTWWYLGILTKKRMEALLNVYASLEEALGSLNEEVLRALGCRPETVPVVLERLAAFSAEKLHAELRTRGIAILMLGEQDYPARLAAVADPPVFLSIRGDASILALPSVALVGTRNVSPYGRRVTERVVSSLVSAGAVTVSGLALGIDAVVAQETIKQGGKTVAVLGHGLGSIYPRANVDLAEKIVTGGGALVSEFALDMRPDTYTFPARNRIVAGLTLGTVVLEAPEKSGSLITAEIASGYGRDVFAVPGPVFDPNYVGCHRLIRSGVAQLVTSGSDILRSLGFMGAAEDRTERTAFIPQDADQKSIYSLLTAMPQSLDDLVTRSGMDAGPLNALLTIVELSGGARNLGGGQWVRG